MARLTWEEFPVDHKDIASLLTNVNVIFIVD